MIWPQAAQGQGVRFLLHTVHCLGLCTVSEADKPGCRAPKGPHRGRRTHLWPAAQERSPPAEAGTQGCSCDASPPASWAALARGPLLTCRGTMFLAVDHFPWAASPPQEGLLPHRHGDQSGERPAGQPWHSLRHNISRSFCRHCSPSQGGLKNPLQLLPDCELVSLLACRSAWEPCQQHSQVCAYMEP